MSDPLEDASAEARAEFPFPGDGKVDLRDTRMLRRGFDRGRAEAHAERDALDAAASEAGDTPWDEAVARFFSTKIPQSALLQAVVAKRNGSHAEFFKALSDFILSIQAGVLPVVVSDSTNSRESLAQVVLAACDRILEPMTTHKGTHLSIMRTRVEQLRAHVEAIVSRPLSDNTNDKPIWVKDDGTRHDHPVAGTGHWEHPPARPLSDSTAPSRLVADRETVARELRRISAERDEPVETWADRWADALLASGVLLSRAVVEAEQREKDAQIAERPTWHPLGRLNDDEHRTAMRIVAAIQNGGQA